MTAVMRRWMEETQYRLESEILREMGDGGEEEKRRKKELEAVFCSSRSSLSLAGRDLDGLSSAIIAS